jgi:hypothetical protein
MKSSRPLSTAAAYNHHRVFIFTLPVSEGRTGEAWEPCNKKTPSLSPGNKVPLGSPMTFPFSYYSHAPSPLPEDCIRANAERY